jgi:hypothetical protein
MTLQYKSQAPIVVNRAETGSIRGTLGPLECIDYIGKYSRNTALKGSQRSDEQN